MTSRKLVALAVSFLLASSSVGFAAGGSPVGVGYGGTGAAALDRAGANVVGIPDMAIGGPPALDVTKDLPSTAPRTAPQMTPDTTPSLKRSVRGTGKRAPQ
jgi:hypothetical protein